MDIFRKKLFTYFPFSVGTSDVRTIFAEKYDVENHLVKTLAEYDAGIRSFSDSSLFKFHRDFKPESIFDLVQSVRDEKLDLLRKCFPKGRYPWGTWAKDGKSWERSRFCGPTPEDDVKDEWDRFIRLYEKVKKEGFIYGRFGYPAGVILENAKGDRRFVVLAGNHRTAVACYIGIEELKVRLINRKHINSVVRIRDMALWPAVSDKTLTEEEARNVFGLFFN